MNESGLCQCGCGGLAPVATKTRRGYIKGDTMMFIQGHHMRTPEYKALALAPERCTKIRAAHIDGRIPDPVPRSGPEHPAWRGDEIGYTRAHARVVEERGPADCQLCAECSAEAHEWAIDHEHQDLRFDFHGGLTKAYSTDVGAYVALCRSCHRTADRRGGYRARSVHFDD